MGTVENKTLEVGSFLKAKLEERVRRNPQYSLRAFARDLDISHTYLSLVLHGKKRLPPKRVLSVSERLALPPEEAQAFLEAARRAYWQSRAQGSGEKGKPQAPDFYVLELDRFKVLSEWYHLALLDLTLVQGFRPEVRWIARQLGISAKEVEAAAKRLERLGLLERRGGTWRKTHAQLTVPATNPAAATRRFHGSMIGRAARALKASSPQSYEGRYIAGSVMAINGARLQEAKRRIARFRKNIFQFLTEGEATDLYQLNVQLFPLVDKNLDDDVNDEPRPSRGRGAAASRSPKANKTRARKSSPKKASR